jgi:ABC-type uncharacterized transport system YnjBCD ATPase subunit
LGAIFLATLVAFPFTLLCEIPFSRLDANFLSAKRKIKTKVNYGIQNDEIEKEETKKM